MHCTTMTRAMLFGILVQKFQQISWIYCEFNLNLELNIPQSLNMFGLDCGLYILTFDVYYYKY